MSSHHDGPQGRMRLRKQLVRMYSGLNFKSSAEHHKDALVAPLSSRVLAGFVFFACLVLLMWLNRSFIKPLAMSAIFAVTLFPADLYLQRWFRSALLRAGLLTLGFSVTFLLPIGIVAFLAADAGLKTVRGLPENWTEQLSLDQWVDRLSQFLPIERADLIRVLQEGLSAAGKAALSLLQNLVADLPKLTVDNTVIVLTLFVFLSESGRLIAWLKQASPFQTADTDDLFYRVSSLARSVILATVASGLAQSILLGVAALVAGFERPVLITMSAFVLSFIPVIGTAPVTVWMIGAAILSENWTQAIVVAAFAMAAGLTDNLIRPAILSGAARLHPLIGFIAAFGGLESIGFYGLFLGPVIAGALLFIIDLVWVRRDRSHAEDRSNPIEVRKP